MTLFKTDSFSDSLTERPLKNGLMPAPIVVEELNFDCIDTYTCNLEGVNTYLQFFHNQLHNSVLSVKSIIHNCKTRELQISGIPDYFLSLFLLVIFTDGFISSLESKHLFIESDSDFDGLSISINNFESSLNDCLALLDQSLSSKKFKHYVSFLEDKDKVDFLLPFIELIGHSFDANNIQKSLLSSYQDDSIDWSTTLSVSLNLKTQILNVEQFASGSVAKMIHNTLKFGECFTSRFSFDAFKSHVSFSNVELVKQVSSAISFFFANLYSGFSLNENDENIVIASNLENFIDSLPSVEKLDAGFSDDLPFYVYDKEMRSKLNRDRHAERERELALKKLARQQRREERREQEKIKREQEENRKRELRLKRLEQETDQGLEQELNASLNQEIQDQRLAEKALEEEKLQQQLELNKKEHNFKKINYILGRKSEIIDQLHIIDQQLSVGSFTDSAEGIKWYRSLKKDFETLSSEFDSLNDMESFIIPNNMTVDLIFSEEEFADYFESFDAEYEILIDRLKSYY